MTSAEASGSALGPMRWDHRVMRVGIALTLRLLLRIYAKWQVIGLENVPRTGPILFAANHASNVDPLLAWASVYRIRRMWGVAKAELWSGKLLSYFMFCIDAIPVRRGAADRVMIRRVLELLAQGKAVGLFPEGTRTRDGKLQPAQPGIALLAQKSGAPILPVALMGTYAMLPAGSKKLRRTRLKVVFGTPMHFSSDCPREQLLEGVMAAIADLMTANGQPTEAPKSEGAPGKALPQGDQGLKIPG